MKADEPAHIILQSNTRVYHTLIRDLHIKLNVRNKFPDKTTQFEKSYLDLNKLRLCFVRTSDSLCSGCQTTAMNVLSRDILSYIHSNEGQNITGQNILFCPVMFCPKFIRM